MNTKLYHLTDREAAKEIMRSGFRPGEDGFVWFGTHPKTIWGASRTSALLEIQVDEAACRQYLQPVEEEEWDPERGLWVKSEMIEGLTWYAFPPEAASRVKPRVLSPRKLREMML